MMLSSKLLQLTAFGADWILWLLIGLSVLSLAAVADRTILLLRTRESLRDLEPTLIKALSGGDLALALRTVQKDSLVRNVVRAGLEQLQSGKRDADVVEQAMLGAMARERARFESRLSALATIGNNAPFVGLFGTVLGIIQAFHELGKSEAAANKAVISAIGEALIATAVGILVAIPAVAFFNWAKSSIAARARHAEALMRAVLVGLGKREPRTAGQDA
jgi:biopolymer transport protein ExbB